MKKTLVALAMAGTLALLLALGAARPGQADATVGKPAPTFSVQDTNGKPVDLAKLKGKYVVLEWWNPECPSVKG